MRRIKRRTKTIIHQTPACVECEEYEKKYLLKNGLDGRKTIYVAKELQNKIADIVTSVGSRELTIGMYVENILLRHIEANKDTINQLNEMKFKKLL